MRKIARTISGVTPVAVMTVPRKCPGHCVYCPTYEGAPQSYTPESPAVLRAIRCEYDAGMQVSLRLRILTDMGHPTDKIELIVMGGTFLASPVEYQYQFIKDCYDAMNGVPSASLEEAKKINETAQHRCTGLCIETRPDWCRQEDIERMLDFGATRVELGVQTLDDDIYELVRRGHKVKEVVDATTRLREHGFKVYYHLMPGLPGSTPRKDLETAEQLFSDENFKPDGLKIYPTMVVEGTELEKWYLEGRYQPYEVDTMIDLMGDIKSVVPRYVRIPRVVRDIPSKFITAGCKESLRDVVKNGREIFLSCEDDQETLFGLLRLRIQDKTVPSMGQVTNGNTALIRELHVFGPEIPLKERKEESAQHKGIGKALLREAERIVRERFQSKRIFILSGTGAKEYYRAECGYRSQGNYMVKDL